MSLFDLQGLKSSSGKAAAENLKSPAAETTHEETRRLVSVFDEINVKSEANQRLRVR